MRTTYLLTYLLTWSSRLVRSVDHACLTLIHDPRNNVYYLSHLKTLCDNDDDNDDDNNACKIRS